MQPQHITVSRTARYFTLGTPSPAITRLWVVCHGFGQLAQYFLLNFREIEQPHTLVVAPEALNRFYIDGTNGRVGATWMTREDRTNEIADYTNYLDTLTEHLLPQLSPDVELYVLGFSQGVATVCRWLSLGRTQCKGLVLWAGVFPPDLEAEAAFAALQNVPVALVVGRQDHYVTEEKVKYQMDVLKEVGLQVKLHWYEGGHQIDPALMASIAKGW